MSDTGDDGDLDGDRIEGSEILCIERGGILYTDIHICTYKYSLLRHNIVK